MASTAPSTVYFAQLSNFSNTNDAVVRTLVEHLDGDRLEVIRVWPIIKKNPFYLAYGIAAALYHHGFRRIDCAGALIERIMKTPEFFGMASAILKRRIRSGGPVRAVIQTQGLFDAAVEGVPLVVYTDDVMLNPLNRLKETVKVPPRLERMERELFAHADVIAVAASHVARSLTDEYAIAPEKIRTVYMGANVAVEPAEPHDADLARYARKRILFVGLDWERKGGPELVEAFGRLSDRHPEARLVIAGSAPAVEHPAIEVLGEVAPDRVAELMAESSLFCMPSRVEPFGIATVEAALAGLPAVGTTTGGFLDIVADGETGLLVAPGDVDGLTAALDRLLGDPRLCLAMGRRAVVRARERFDWRSVSKRLAALIDEAVDEHPPH